MKVDASMKLLRSIRAAMRSHPDLGSCEGLPAVEPDPTPLLSTAAVRLLYVINYRPGPTWLAGRPLGEQGLEQHGSYMYELAQRGQLLVAGPLSTIEGGLVILRVASIDEATSLMQADPAVLDGKFTGEISVWRPGIDPAGRFASDGNAPDVRAQQG